MGLATRVVWIVFCLALVTAWGSALAQDEAVSDPYWHQFDQLYPQIAGRGEAIWTEAGRRAALQLGEDDSEAYRSLQRLIFQALAVVERDRKAISERTTDPQQRQWAQSRREAAAAFEKNMDTIKQLRAKPESELTQDDMTQLLRSTVAAMQYIYDAQMEAREVQLGQVVAEQEPVADAAAVTPPQQVEPTPADAKPASGGTYKAYLQADRIRIDDSGGYNAGRHSYNRNQVRAVGAIKNLTDHPTAYHFKIIAMRSGNRPIGMKTVETPVLQPGEVREIDEVVPVTESAYLRDVDMQDVRMVSP